MRVYKYYLYHLIYVEIKHIFLFRISELLDKVKASESSMQKASELKDLEIQKLENEVQKLTMDKLNMELEIAQLRSDESASETSEPVVSFI